jgi:hypothetical protein
VNLIKRQQQAIETLEAKVAALETAVVPFTSMTDTTAYEEYCEASLDLSNQDEVGEAGAIAALDDLYANNDEGMKRLADAS